MGDKKYDKATLAFQKLSPNPGDIVVITFPEDIHPTQMQLFAEDLQPKIPEDVSILCTRAGVEVKKLPEMEMNKLGWYKFNNKTVN